MSDAGQQAAIVLMTGVRLRHRRNQQRTEQKKARAKFVHRCFPPFYACATHTIVRTSRLMGLLKLYLLTTSRANILSGLRGHHHCVCR
jgi:hypothetical protein